MRLVKSATPFFVLGLCANAWTAEMWTVEGGRVSVEQGDRYQSRTTAEATLRLFHGGKTGGT